MIGHIKGPLDLSHQDAQTKQQLLSDPSLMEGEWNFKGYYPFGCKIRPPCHTRQLTFKNLTKDPKSEWHVYQTDVAKMGDYCAIEEKDSQNLGFTWVHGNKIQYGGGNNERTPSFLFRWTATPYYYDSKDGQPNRLFIKDKDNAKRCFQVFEQNLAGKKVNPDQYNVDEVDKFNRFLKRDKLRKELENPWSFDNLPISDEIQKIRPYNA